MQTFWNIDIMKLGFVVLRFASLIVCDPKDKKV